MGPSSKARDEELAAEMVDLLRAAGAPVSLEDVKQAFLLGLKIGRADARLLDLSIDYDDLDA
jgi:hypothetical protein